MNTSVSFEPSLSAAEMLAKFMNAFVAVHIQLWIFGSKGLGRIF